MDSRPTDGSTQPRPDVERQAIEACQDGQVEGLRVLYERYSSKVHRTCYRILGDSAAADDATQDIFLRVFERIGGFEGRSRFSTWLYRVSVNHALGLLARARTRRRVTTATAPGAVVVASDQPADPFTSTGTAGPEQAFLQSEREHLLVKVLSELAPVPRAIIVLREIEGLSYRQISEVMEVPIGTVMSRLSRARAELRASWFAAIEPHGIEEPARSSRMKETDR